MTPENHILISSAAAGLAAAWLAWLVLSIVGRSRRTDAAAWEFEAARRMRLCQASSIYRWFEPLVDELAERNRGRRGDLLATIGKRLSAVGDGVPWKPEEYVAVKQLEALLGGVAGAVAGYVMSGFVTAAIAGIGLFLLLLRVGMGDLRDRAANRVSKVKRRLPFAVDLIALMLEAGGGLLDSLTTLVRDMKGHPLGDELGAIQSEINLGRPMRECFGRFQQRVPDDDVAELVFMINKGDEFGTPMAQTFRLQAEQMRLKRSQWAEKAAGSAEVNIVFPAMVIMIACLLIIAAPFLLAALYVR
jgi:tight adherence protein C